MKMKRNMTLASIAVFIGLFGAAVFTSPSVGAIDVYGGCKGVNDSAVCSSTKDSLSSMIRPITTTMLYIIGAIAVIMIIIGGIMYTISSGDPGKTKKAKDTILYSVIGLVVAIMAYGIVEFVLDRVG